MGSSTLASWLLQPADESTILQRQAAVKELVLNNNCRQKLLAYGKEKKIESETRSKLNNWLAEPSIFLQFKICILK